ncbi:MAG: GIY-YIG nuclease family protein [Candidatus Levyibacteriota bacterium]
MYYVYVLKSTLKNYHYTGCTDNLRKRLHEHQKGKTQSTKPYLPFELIYYEACKNKTDAYQREKYLKSRLGKTYIGKRLRNWFNKNA